MLWEKTCNIPRKKVVDLKKEVIIYKINLRVHFWGLMGINLWLFFSYEVMTFVSMFRLESRCSGNLCNWTCLTGHRYECVSIVGPLCPHSCWDWPQRLPLWDGLSCNEIKNVFQWGNALVSKQTNTFKAAVFSYFQCPYVDATEG